MSRNAFRYVAVIVPLSHSPAHADAGGPGTDFAVVLGVIFYLVLCCFSLPISLLLRVRPFRRLAFGFGAPLLGIGLGFTFTEALDRMHYVDESAIAMAIFIGISVLPVLALLAFGAVDRMNRK